MSNPLLRSLSLLDPSGYVIIAVIVALLIVAISTTIVVRARYGRIARELRRHPGSGAGFEAPVLRAIVEDTESALAFHPGEINTQAIIESHFESELRGLLLGERFVKASTGLLIILGLVGTFYGLTLSIGRLVGLITGEGAAGAELTESLMSGLTQALSGMSVAFSTSLFGIVSAIVMTLVGVFANIGDRRVALMVQIEAYLDSEIRRMIAAPDRSSPGLVPAGGPAGSFPSHALERAVAGFGQSVAQLSDSIAQFEAALEAFAGTTRDFREFNLHLKDNVQRMSLQFGDLSETLKQHVHALRARG